MARDAFRKTVAAANMRSRSAKLNVFISYSRQDIAFVDRLQAAIAAHGIEAFVDREYIEKSEEWWVRIKQLITDADTFVFVLSPGSVDSAVCKDEVAFAEKLNKRFVPIVARDLEGREVPAALARLNYIFFIPNATADASGDFDATVSDLVRALETDIPWIRDHTRLGALAERWEAQKRPSDLLLRGAELNAAETWLTTRPDKAPDPTDAHRAFLTESRKAATRRQRMIVGLSVAAAMVAAALAGIANWQRGVAVQNEARAMKSEAAAKASELRAIEGEKTARDNESRAFAALSVVASNDNWFVGGVALALAGWPRDAQDSRPRLDAALRSLGVALSTTIPISTEVRLSGEVLDAGVDPANGTLVAVSRRARGFVLTQWDMAKGEKVFEQDSDREWSVSRSYSRAVTASADGLRKVDLRTQAQVLLNPVRGAHMNPNGQSFLEWPAYGPILGSSEEPGSRLHVRAFLNGQVIGATKKLNDAEVMYNKSGSRFVTVPSTMDIIDVWDARTGHQAGVTLQNPGQYQDISNDGTMVATRWPGRGQKCEIRVWDVRTGRLIGKPVLSDEIAWGAKFSDDGSRLLVHWSGFVPGTRPLIKIWDVAGGKQIRPSIVPKASVISSVKWIANDTRILTVGIENTIQVWDTATGQRIGSEIHQDGSTDSISAAQLFPDKKRVVSAAKDGTIRLWDLATGKQMGPAMRHDGGVTGVTILEEGKRLLSWSADETVRVWEIGLNQQEGAEMLLDDNAGQKGDISVILSRDAKHLIAGSTAAMWLWDTGTRLPLSKNLGQATDWTFSRDSRYVIARLQNGTLRLWDADTGQQIDPATAARESVQPMSPFQSADACGSDGKRCNHAGNRILTWSIDNALRLRDARSGLRSGQPWRTRVPFGGRSSAATRRESCRRMPMAPCAFGMRRRVFPSFRQ
jgi:WD40 repeat protein